MRRDPLSLLGARTLPWERRRTWTTAALPGLPPTPGWLASPGAPPAAGLARALEPDLFQEAFSRVRRHGGPGTDGISARAFARDLDRELGRLRGQMLDGTYRPLPLLRLAIPKKDGGLRILGIPCVRDRVAQVAVHLAVTPALDTRLLPLCHGYRRGRSPASAVDHLVAQVGTRPWLEVLKADVEGLFDHLDHGILTRVVAQVWGDPLWNRLFRTWLAAWQDRATPGRGVPQGAPLSPWWANLYLHEGVDRHLATPPVGIVAAIRYGDDFVLAADRPGAGVRMLQSLEGLLSGCRLTLSPRKTTFTCGRENLAFPEPVLGLRVAFTRSLEGWSLQIIPGGLVPIPHGGLDPWKPSWT